MNWLKAEKLVIYKKPSGWWIRIEFENGTSWTPALQHLGYLLNGIGQCEDLKYPSGKGRKLPQEFCFKCFDGGFGDIDKLVDEYKIPKKNNLPLIIEESNKVFKDSFHL